MNDLTRATHDAAAAERELLAAQDAALAAALAFNRVVQEIAILPIRPDPIRFIRHPFRTRRRGQRR